jgi:hypothetical protein
MNERIINISKILGVILILLSIVFLGLQAAGREFDAFGVKAAAMSLLVILYLVRIEKKNILFLLFLVTYAIADIYNYLTFSIYVPESINYDLHYLVCNALYGVAYLFLIFRIFSLMNIKKTLSRLPFQVALLFALGTFVVYMITDLSNPEVMLDYEYEVEILYNILIMFLVCLSLINYMYNDTRKSMNMLIGSICIIFSEVFQIAYYYITTYDVVISFAYSFFLIGAFACFYCQSKLVQEYNTVYESY